MTQLTVSQAMIPVNPGNADGYIQIAHRFPVLSKEAEYELASSLSQDNNLEAARKLVLHNLRFVIRVARGYLGYGLPLADLAQEGSVGLMKAVKRFDPEVGVRLISFAVHWIRAEIHEYIIKNWRIVKIATTKAQRKLFFNLRSSKKRLGWFSQAEINAVAEDLGVKPKEVVEMESRLSKYDVGFDLSADDDDESTFSPSAYLQSPVADPAQAAEAEDTDSKASSDLSTALSVLDDRSRDILQRRWLSEKKATLQTLAAEYGVSAERIRQLENNAMKKMRQSISETA